MASVIPGDVNGDGTVNGLDISLVSAYWLRTGQGIPGDANGDGVVNGLDIATISSNWLRSIYSGAGGAAAVPEPSTIVLAAVGVYALLVCRRLRWPDDRWPDIEVRGTRSQSD